MNSCQQFENLPERSRLCSLRPSEVGTEDVEHLASYVMRLADSHASSVRYLLAEEIYSGDYNGNPVTFANWMIRASSICGISTEAGRMVEVLERKTLRQDLHTLTLRPWREIIGRRFLLRPSRAWCPACFESMRLRDVPVYEKLVWAIALVEHCPTHRQPIETRCPKCASSQQVLVANSMPGHCHKCFAWLGTRSSPLDSGLPSPYQLWVAETVGELVAAAGQVDCARFIAVYRDEILRHASQDAGGSVKALSRARGVNYSAILNRFRDGQPVQIDFLLRGLFDLGLPVASLLGNQQSTPMESTPSLPNRDNRPIVQPYYKAAALREFLKKEINASHPRSPRELAFQLGYGNSTQLWRADRALYAQLKERTKRVEGPTQSKTPSKNAKDDAKCALKRSLAYKNSKSVRQISKDLGYFGEATLRNWFPDLCKAVSANLNRCRSEAVRGELDRALQERPHPSLNQVARRSGFTVSILKGRAPKLCDELQALRRSNLVMRKDRMQDRLVALMSEDPPTSGAEICAQLKISWGLLSSWFPKLAQQLARRNQNHRDQQRRARADSIFAEVSKVVRELHSMGEYPSALRIVPLLTGKSLDWRLVNEARRTALAELDAEQYPHPAHSRKPRGPLGKPTRPALNDKTG